MLRLHRLQIYYTAAFLFLSVLFFSLKKEVELGKNTFSEMLCNFYHFVKCYYSQVKGDGIVTLS